MPKFLDHHPTAPMPPEMAQAAVQKIKDGTPDQFGTVALNVIVGEKDTWCITESPSADAVHKGHEAIGINLGPGDAVEVQTLA